MTLRTWQINALDTYIDWEMSRGSRKAFTAAVTMGAGKTRYGVEIASWLLLNKRFQQVIIGVPSLQIANQWKLEAARYSTPFVPLTYSWIYRNQDEFERMVSGSKTMLIADEVHHAGEHKSWGEMLRQRAQKAGRYLLLTGTPFRDDECKLPFVRYVKHELQPDYTYSYADALRDGYVRPLHFTPYNGTGSWTLNEALKNGTFGGARKPDDLQRLLNVSIETKSNFMKRMIQDAHWRLDSLRKTTMPDAGGIIICRDQEHARQMKRLVQALTHSNPVLAISDDPNSDEHITRFRDNADMWLIVVGKGKEGLDIPRLSVGVWATNVTRRLTFLQFIGRVIRQRVMGAREDAYVFMPAHPALVGYAYDVEKMVTHHIEEKAVVEGVEQALREKQSGGIIPISADAEPQQPIVIQRPSTDLETLIQIQQMAAAGIADIARGLPSGDVMQKISALLMVNSPSPTTSPTAP